MIVDCSSLSFDKDLLVNILTMDKLTYFYRNQRFGVCFFVEDIWFYFTILVFNLNIKKWLFSIAGLQRKIDIFVHIVQSIL